MPDDSSPPAPAAPATPAPSAPATPRKTTVKHAAKAPAAKPASTTTLSASPATSVPAKSAAAAAPKPVKKAPVAPPKPAASKWEKTKTPSKPAGPPPKVVDATGLVLGRAASLLAKRLMKGETIVVVNTEKAVVLGGYADVVEKYRAAVARGSVRKGPHYPRRPDRMFRRTVRGMLPYRHPGGHEAWSRILTYIGEPEEFRALPKETLESARARPSLRPPMTLGEISHRVGGVGTW